MHSNFRIENASIVIILKSFEGDKNDGEIIRCC